MKKIILPITLLLSTLTVNAQTTACSELFFTEIVKGNVNDNQDYAVEIFNPTSSAVNLNDYTVQLNKVSGIPTTITLSGELPAGEVYVICHPGASTMIQGVSDKITSTLDFDNTAQLLLKHNTTVIDKFGQDGVATTDVFDEMQFFLDPVTYVSSWHIDVNDFQDYDIRRTLYASKGDPVFSSGLSLIGNWGYYSTEEVEDLGSYIGICNQPLGSEVYGYYDAQKSMFYGSGLGAVDPLTIANNGSPNAPINNVLELEHKQIGGNLTVCNGSSATLKWRNVTGFPCSTVAVNVAPSVILRPEVEFSGSNTSSVGSVVLELKVKTSGSGVGSVDPASKNHTINVNKHNVSISKVDGEPVAIYPTITQSDVTIVSGNAKNYVVTDMSGKRLLSGQINTTKHIINMSNLASGMYLIQLSSGQGVTCTQKIVKQ